MMPGAVLLILRVPESDTRGVALRRINGRLDVSSVDERYSSLNEDAAERAFLYASQASRPLVAVQLLTSDLFHWGMCDNILSGQAKMRFIGYVREQILNKSVETTRMLEEKSRRYDVVLEIKKIETDDPSSAALSEAAGGYDRIFIAHEKKKIFPLFKKSMGQHLRSKTSVPVVAG